MIGFVISSDEDKICVNYGYRYEMISLKDFQKSGGDVVFINVERWEDFVESFGGNNIKFMSIEHFQVTVSWLV